jgi:protein-S-isoprenylcysteine O-methyltransferase Ste14
MMLILDYLTTALLIIWCISELGISLISYQNNSSRLSNRADKLSYFVIWLSIIPPICFAMLLRAHPIFTGGWGSFSALFPLLGYLGSLLMICGIALRLIAVATLKRQFTTQVSILEKHEIIDTGIYGIIRHPAYLGLLVSLLGIGLISENWVSLLVLIVLPLMAVLYRIRVEEQALHSHFGSAYQMYADRTKRLLPKIW